MKPGSTQNLFRSFRIARRFLAAVVVLSFAAVLIPLTGASANKSNPMACCAGKATSHCDSGLASEKPPPPPEPMCGLETAGPEDAITIVAEPLETKPHHASHGTAEFTSSGAESIASQHAFDAASLSQPCHMDGCVCTASTRQQNRERSTVHGVTNHSHSLSTVSHYETPVLFFSSNEDWDQTSPRGPPVSQL